MLGPCGDKVKYIKEAIATVYLVMIQYHGKETEEGSLFCVLKYAFINI